MVAPLLEEHRPDLLRIDPLLAFLGGDILNVEDTAAFLRNGLNPLLTTYQCGAMIAQYTPKTTNRNSDGLETVGLDVCGGGQRRFNQLGSCNTGY